MNEPAIDFCPAPVDFADLPSLIARHALERPASIALRMGQDSLSHAALEQGVARVAASLQRDGLGPGACVVICAATSLAYLTVFLGALRAGLAVAPLAPGATPSQLGAMAADADAAMVFTDAEVASAGVVWPAGARVVLTDDSTPGLGLTSWLCPVGTRFSPVAIRPEWPFNLIYSSGTTGTPKGIVQPHAMRWAHVQRAAVSGYGPDTVTLIATPLYSNTTLVCLFPTLARGGCAVLMPKFDALAYLKLAQEHRATHTMLVPVQYRRLLAYPGFDAFDLSSFRYKMCTSAPFHADLKAEVLRRWPGALVEYYGLTEGGGTCILQAHLHPDKLHTVGQPAEGHDIRLIDEAGVELPHPPGGASPGVGEVVGRSPGMMLGYHRQSELSAASEWFDAQGQRFLRTGDLGRFDDEGFLILHDRRKDMVISGGFNVYPSDLEAVLRQHPAVADAAVVGVPSAQWGETPVAFVVRREGASLSAQDLREAVNANLGKTQRLSALEWVDELPRSAIGKVLKRELREAWVARGSQA